MQNIILISAAHKKNKNFLLSKFIEKWKEKKWCNWPPYYWPLLNDNHHNFIKLCKGFFLLLVQNMCLEKNTCPVPRQKIALFHHNNGFNFCRIFHLPLTSRLPNSPPSVHGHTHSLPPPMPHRAHTVHKRLASRIRVQWV